MTAFAATELPLLDPARMAAAARATLAPQLHAAFRVLGLAAGGCAFAATLWLILAGPGFLAEAPGAAGHARVASAARR